LILVLKRAMVV